MQSANTFLNYFNGTITQTHTGQWEDLQSYTSVAVRVISTHPGQLILSWALTDRGNYPPGPADIIKSTTYEYSGFPHVMVLTEDTIARWFQLSFQPSQPQSVQISVRLEALSTYLKIADDQHAPVTVQSGLQGFQAQSLGLWTILTDVQGLPVGSTNTISNFYTSYDAPSALYVTPTTVSANDVDISLKIVPPYDGVGSTLSVYLCDKSGWPLSLNPDISGIYVHPCDSSGFSQAGTYEVSGATVSGIALYLSSDIDSTDTFFNTRELSGNALWVDIVDLSGNSIGTSFNPLPISIIDNYVFSFPFDISNSLTSNIPVGITPFGFGVLLSSLFLYNDGPVTAWVSLYDQPDSSFTPGVVTPQMTLAVPGGAYRDLVFSAPCTFFNGLYLTANTVPGFDYNSGESPGPGTVFANGIYNLINAP